jgi:hypothetical protein
MDDEFSFKDMSLFALQATADLSDGLSATAQILARGTNDFDAEFEWAYIKYQFNENFDIKVGRLRQPTYFYSEFIDVSYAYHWISTPEEFYNSVLTSYEGIALYYTNSIGKVDYSIQFGNGTSDKTLRSGTYFSGKYDFILNVDFTYDFWTTKFIYIKSRITVEADSLIAVQAAFPDYPDLFNIQDQGSLVAGLASYLNFDQFFLGVEYAQVSSDGLTIAIPEDERLLLTGGYRLNDWLFHYTYGNSQKENDLDHFDSSDPRYPILLAIGGQNDTETTTHTLGVVYDFHPSAKLKFEVGTIKVDLTNIDTSFVRSGIAVVF